MYRMIISFTSMTGINYFFVKVIIGRPPFNSMTVFFFFVMKRKIALDCKKRVRVDNNTYLRDENWGFKSLDV